MTILEYENYHEKKTHGNPDFPYITYPCSIPLDFTEVPLHWHEEMEIIYIKKGEGLVFIDLTPHPVAAGTLCFIVPGQLHSIHQKDSFSMEYENIIFHLDMLKASPIEKSTTDYFLPLQKGQLVIPPILTPEHELYSAVVSCIDAADDICRTFPKAYELAIKAQLYFLFHILFSRCSADQKSGSRQRSLDRIRPVIKYVENHYDSAITIPEIAKEVGLSESHFMKFFKNTMGVSFIEYLNDYRLTMASRMLLSSADSVLTVAIACGYENLSYFNRLFKRRFHMTPREYRKASA